MGLMVLWVINCVIPRGGLKQCDDGGGDEPNVRPKFYLSYKHKLIQGRQYLYNKKSVDCFTLAVCFSGSPTPSEFPIETIYHSERLRISSQLICRILQSTSYTYQLHPSVVLQKE
jgi:hypothetical protein